MAHGPTAVIIGSNVNEVMPQGVRHVLENNRQAESRNGPVRKATGAMISHYIKPHQRMLFSPARDCNPIFHILESLWMLGGRDDVAFPSNYAANIANFSDNGQTLNGAYGHRWVRKFGVDQLELVVQHLKKNWNSRRCVLQMWHAGDLMDCTYGSTSDVPCNLSIKFELEELLPNEPRRRLGSNLKLNMWVMCRSNDLLWGAYGANAVHMSFLQEYIADRLGANMGFYEQFSMDAHLYTEQLYGAMYNRVVTDITRMEEKAVFDVSFIQRADDPNPYADAELGLFTLSPVLCIVSKNNDEEVFSTWSEADGITHEELASLFKSNLDAFLNATPGDGAEVLAGMDANREDLHPYFRLVVQPLAFAHVFYKAKNYDRAIQIIQVANMALIEELFEHTTSAGTLDIFQNTIEWLERRKAAAAAKSST